MAETCSLPEQQLVPLASGLRKGVDERMRCVTEKNLGGEWLWDARKSVGCQGPGQECWHTAFLLFASLKCTVLLHVQMPPTPRTPTQDGHLAHSELFLPPWAVWQCPSHPFSLRSPIYQPSNLSFYKTFSLHNGMTYWLPANTKIVWALFICSMLRTGNVTVKLQFSWIWMSQASAQQKAKTLAF